MNNSFQGTKYACHKFNGGKNAFGHETHLFSSRQFGKYSGLTIVANMSKNSFLFYYVGENRVQPTYSEMTMFIQPDKVVFVGIKKTVDTKLPEPYNNCEGNINSETSHLVMKVLEQNITYRRVNCYDLCLQEYASKRNISTVDAYNGFNFIVECSRLCPAECSSHKFEVDQNELEVRSESPHVSRVTFFFYEPRYTEITQTVKTTEADLISNTGGVLGLFLEISFISAYRFIVYLIDVISA